MFESVQKIIIQEHGMGCAVACVAYAAQKTYQQALKLFDSPENAWLKGFYCRDLVTALAKAGFEYKYFYFRKLKHQKFLRLPGVIVFIKRCKRYPLGHYLIKTEDGKWMNPWSNFPTIYPLQGKLQTRLPGETQYILIPLRYINMED